MSKGLSIGIKLERAGVAVSLLSAAVALAGGFARAAQGQEAADAGVAPQGGVEEIVVTARNRSERAQNVPVPISVIGGDADRPRARAFTIADLTQRAPALTATTPNARRTGVSHSRHRQGQRQRQHGSRGRGHRRRRVPRPRRHVVSGLHGPRARRDPARAAGHAARQEHLARRDQVHEPSAEFHARRLVRRRARARTEARARRAARISERAGRRRARVPRLVLHRQAGRRSRQRQPGVAVTGTSATATAGACSCCTRRRDDLSRKLQLRPRRDRREQQHQAVHGRSDDARRRIAARHDVLDHGSRAATSAATRRSSARGTRSTSTWRKPLQHRQRRASRRSSTGMSGAVEFTSITRRALVLTSTRTTTRSRRASRSARSGTLVDTRAGVAGVALHRR